MRGREKREEGREGARRREVLEIDVVHSDCGGRASGGEVGADADATGGR